MRALVAASLLIGITLPLSASWTILETGVTARLRGISAPSDQVVWASGTGGTVIRSITGGQTWQRRAIPGADALDFRDIDAFDENIAYALSIGNGDASRIYRTSDGGETWTLQLANTDPRVFLDAMAFWSPERGIAFSDSVDGRFVIFRTDDGKTWTQIASESLPAAVPEEGAYAASGTNVAVYGSAHVWIATSRSRVLRSADGGRTWNVAATPLPSGSASGIFSIAFRDERHGVIVGGDYQKTSEAIDNAAVTSDGGATWSLVKGLAGFRSVIAHRPGSRTWYAAGPTGVDMSPDDGKTWGPAAPMTDLHTFTFTRGGRSGWGAGERGRIVRLDP
jgi:photosystem II stability/assembly factor-like uncharacterized protein